MACPHRVRSGSRAGRMSISGEGGRVEERGARCDLYHMSLLMRVF